MSDRGIMVTALMPVVLYLIAMAAVFALTPSHFPAIAMAAGGSFVTFLSVGFASFLRLRRDRKPHA